MRGRAIGWRMMVATRPGPAARARFHPWLVLVVASCLSADETGPSNPQPFIEAIVPPSLTTVGPTTITLLGEGFVESSQATWNGSVRPTQYASPTMLTVQLESGDIDETGSDSVTVVNPEPGGGTSM